MTDPVDTDALRGVSARLAAVPVSGTAEQRMTVVRAQVELTRAANEVDRLRAVIESAPHREKCRPHIACTCWKADAL